MQYLPKLGTVMDTLQYSMLYYSYTLFEFRENAMFFHEEDPLLYFNQFRMAKRRIEPPNSLYPFFIYHPRYQEHYALFKYFWNHIDEAAENPMAFFDCLDSEEFYFTCMEYYFGGNIPISGLKANNTSTLIKAMAFLDNQGYKTDAFVDFLSDFNALVKVLIDYLKECYGRIEAFRNRVIEEEEEKILKVFQQEKDTIQRMCSISSDVSLDDQKYTIHVMEHLSLLCKRKSREDYIILACASLERAILHWGDSSYITLKSFGEDFGNDVSYDIIQKLRDGEMTAAQLAKELYTSRSTTDRYIKALKDNQVIIISRQIGTEVYYSLNAKYFLTLKAKIIRDVNEILEDICKSSSSF